MNSDSGAEISELLAHLSGITVPAHSNADWVKIRELQRHLDGKAASLRSEHRIRAGFAEEQRWAETDIHGFERALILVGDGDAGTSRLERRLNTRLARVSELDADIEEIDERIRRIEADVVSTQQVLVVVLRRTIGNAEHKIQTAKQARMQRKAAFQTMLDGIDETPLWSPYAVMGYRIWAVKDEGLHGIRHRWKTPRLDAVCKVGGDLPHTDGRCAEVAFGCGIYVAKSAPSLMRDLAGKATTGFAVGLVGMEGKVVEHERGYRAAAATVLTLALVDHGSIRLIDKTEDLAAIFARPSDAAMLGVYGSPRTEDVAAIRNIVSDYLEAHARKRATWTSANPNE